MPTPFPILRLLGDGSFGRALEIATALTLPSPSGRGEIWFFGHGSGAGLSSAHDVVGILGEAASGFEGDAPGG